LVNEISEFIKENDVKFVKLSFCDSDGVQRNVSIVSSEFERAVKEGISVDASVLPGFSGLATPDIFLVPDISTVNILPWRPAQGRVIRFYSDILNADKTVCALDTRDVLKRAVKRCADMGYTATFGTECEFYLFRADENGMPTYIPHDRAGILDLAPPDRGEDVRREICLTLEEMGIKPETSHHECGPGQNEIDFVKSAPIEAADHFLTFKSVVKSVAHRSGLFASFMPKPLAGESGNGLHLNISLFRDGKNIFKSRAAGHSAEGESFIAGVIGRVKEITAFLNPTLNSYDRFGEFYAPKYIAWSHTNRTRMIRIPAAEGEKVRMELRSPDPALNPYLSFALILNAGLDGIQRGLKLGAPTEGVDDSDGLQGGAEALPSDLGTAAAAAESSEFVRGILGTELLSNYIALKRAEIKAYEDAGDKSAFVYNQYFSRI
jgi:glutamine synthetase